MAKVDQNRKKGQIGTELDRIKLNGTNGTEVDRVDKGELNGPNETELHLIGLKWTELNLGGLNCAEWTE